MKEFIPWVRTSAFVPLPCSRRAATASTRGGGPRFGWWRAQAGARRAGVAARRWLAAVARCVHGEALLRWAADALDLHVRGPLCLGPCEARQQPSRTPGSLSRPPALPARPPPGDVLLPELGPFLVPHGLLPCPPSPSIARSAASVGANGYGRAGEVGVGRRGRLRRAAGHGCGAGHGRAGQGGGLGHGRRAGQGGGRRGGLRWARAASTAMQAKAGDQAKARAGADGVVRYDQDPGLIHRRDLHTSRSRELPDGSRIAGGRSCRG